MFEDIRGWKEVIMNQMRQNESDYNQICRLYELYEKKMYIVAFSILKNQWQAEDAVSEAFIKIIRHREKFADLESDETKRYIICLIQNTAIDIYRKNKTDQARFTVLDARYEASIGMQDHLLLHILRSRLT